MKQISPHTKIIAVEPEISKPFSSSILAGKIVAADKVSKFCNGSSVKTTSQTAF
jgi:threonine dehydratase